MPRTSLLLGVALGLSLFTACSASSTGGAGNQGGGGAGGQNNGPGGAGGNNFGGDNFGGDNFGGGFASGAGGSNNNTNCSTPAGVDDDGDGFSEDQGDCNDCDKNVNPGAIEVIAEPDDNGVTPEAADENCDMLVDNVVEDCDSGLLVGDPDAFAGARAIDLCQVATPGDQKWGVLEAKYVRANGSASPPPNALQWGLKAGFGPNVNVQRGKRMLVLSAGYARDAYDSDACNGTSCYSNSGGVAPSGFPQDVPNCSGSTNINDDVALDLKLRTPTNATGYAFNFKFYSFEFPEWVCTSFNDQFIALVNPAPMGSINGNVSFDKNTNPVSVNIAFFDVCDPASATNWAQLCGGANCPPIPDPYCPSGIGELQGNGFYEWDMFGFAGGTSWLKTQAPVEGGKEINIRFAVWDTGDTALDSTAVIDNFQWIANGGTVNLGTDVIPDPQ